MKKLLLTALFGLFAVTGFSQISLDVHGGMTMNNFTGGDAKSYDMKVGYTFGVGVNYELTDMWSVQSGINITQKGASYEYADEDGYAKEKYNPIYLELPIMGALNINITDNIKFIANAGPYFAYGIGGKLKSESMDTYYEEVTIYKESSNCFGKDKDGLKVFDKRFDMGIQYGIGFEINNHYMIKLQGQNGFLNCIKDFDEIDDYDGGYKTIYNNLKNMSFSITLGYKF